jgi:GntR family transcriptional regulator, transcriptional repressor for pyruvate dehydrogenase complex
MLKLEDLKLHPARRERLADILYGQLLELISSSKFDRGERLPSEAKLAQAFGASRPTVREALTRLRADGLVYAKHGSGNFIRSRPPLRITEFAVPADIADYLRSFEPRIVLETEAARLAAARRTRQHLAKITGAYGKLEKSVSDGSEAREHDLAFHMAVADATGNAMFPRLLEGLSETLLGTMHMALSLTRLGSELRRQQVLFEHQQILDAIAAGDTESAALYMRYHLTRARERVTDAQREV